MISQVRIWVKVRVKVKVWAWVKVRVKVKVWAWVKVIIIVVIINIIIMISQTLLK
jgi:hypothetical protein